MAWNTIQLYKALQKVWMTSTNSWIVSRLNYSQLKTDCKMKKAAAQVEVTMKIRIANSLKRLKILKKV